MRGNLAYEPDYATLAKECGITIQQIYLMISFEMLEREDPIQPLAFMR